MYRDIMDTQQVPASIWQQMIQQNFLKAQAKKLAQDIKQNQIGLTGSVDLEKMKELSDLHKNRVQLKK